MFSDRLGLLHGLFAPGSFEALERTARDLLSYGLTEATPAVDVWANDDEVVVVAEVAGVDPEAIDIAVEDRGLRLRVAYAGATVAEGETATRRERPRGEFERMVTLPYRVDGERTAARCKDGLLEIRMPRATEDKPRKINVQSK